MGQSMDNRARTEAREKASAAKLDEIHLYTLTELEPILGVTHRTLQTYIKDRRQVESQRGDIAALCQRRSLILFHCPKTTISGQ